MTLVLSLCVQGGMGGMGGMDMAAMMKQMGGMVRHTRIRTHARVVALLGGMCHRCSKLHSDILCVCVCVCFFLSGRHGRYGHGR